MSPKSNSISDVSGAGVPEDHNVDPKNGRLQDGCKVSENDPMERVDLEDALNLIGVGRYTRGVLLVACYALLAVSTEIFGVGLLVTAAQCDLELDTFRKGLVGAVPMLGILVSSHTWGYVADTRGRRYAVLIALAGSWSLGLVSSFVNHWLALALLKFLSVIFASGANAVVYAFLVEMTPAALRNRYMMLATTFLMISQSLLGTLGFITLRYDFNIPMAGLNITYRPWRLLAQVYALLNALAMIMFVTCVFESPKFYLSQGREKEGMEVLRKMYAANTGKRPEDFPVKSILINNDASVRSKVGLLQSMWDQTAPLFRGKFLKNTLLVMYVAVVVFSTAPPMVIWLPHIVNAFMRSSSDVGPQNFCSRVMSELDRSRNDSTTLGVCEDRVDDLALYTMMALGGVITTAGLVSTLLVRWIGKRGVVVLLNVLSGLSTLALDHAPGAAAMIVFLLVNCNAVGMGVVSAFAVEIYPTYLRSMAVCLTIMAGRGASFVVINSIGVQVENNCQNFFYFYGAFILSAAVVGLFLPGEKKKEVQKNP